MEKKIEEWSDTDEGRRASTFQLAVMKFHHKMTTPINGTVIDAVALSYVACTDIAAWWKGEISGRRCVKTVIDGSAAIAGGVSGHMAGSLIGNMVVPGLGGMVGSFVGGLVGGAVAGVLSQWLTDYFFDLPQREALKNAYIFLKVERTCTNAELNSAYRRLALKYHPDKGGSKDDWVKLQTALEIIKQERGQGV